MANSTTIAAALARLSVHFRITRTEEETEVVLRDWVRALDSFQDEIIREATDSWIVSEDRFPPLARMLDTVQSEARRLLRTRSEARALPQGPKNDEPLADSHAHAEIIRLVNGFEGGRKSEVEVRGHDHHGGAEDCPICTKARAARVRAERDRDLDPEPVWSPCAECDGTGFVWLIVGSDESSVRPCRICNARNYDLWSGGHFRLNHRCEECSSSPRRRVSVE